MSTIKPSKFIMFAAVLLAGCGPMNETVGTARVRVVHASPDAPAVNICADGAVLFSNAAFPGATDYASVPAATYAVKVVPATGDCADAGVIQANLPLAAGTDTTVIAVNTLAAIEPLVLADDNQAPSAGSARVRFVHASPNAPTVDITLADGTTLFDNVAFKGVGDYIEVAAGTYDLEVRDETGTTTVLPLDGVQLQAGTVYTVYAVGLLNGTPALGAFITMDNAGA
ncbi:MAG TPA: DUF4397 domain-containing protein [Phycisphaerae bacterium]|nr:DUF4397 domain-containing protein [Phycisphaerales bacterium]HRX85085.1 DUF4397 domain-containing protein [Phycisphaerae bacterium]